jgi:hypothetical protein
MGKPNPPEKALLFIASLFSEEEYYNEAKEIIIREFGELSFESDVLPWNHSEYYREELGWPISRRFFAFKELINPEGITEIKLITNNLEQLLTPEGRRKINLDPGYVTLSKVVLATTKNYAHRIYLGKGIYAEVTLYYRQGRFRPHDFTYRDYRSEEYNRIFLKLREFVRKG